MDVTAKTPSRGIVVPYYVFAAVSFLLLCILLFFSASAFTGHYFQPRILAITHITALGWGSMIIMGALHQFLPVIFERSLFSERLAKLTFFVFSAGIIWQGYAFWNFSVGFHLQLSSVLILIGIILFVINVFFTAHKPPASLIEADFIITSVLWLLFTGILGVLMAFNFVHAFLPKSHLLFLKIHAHMGMVGWFVMLIMGVGSKLIPMFLLSHNLNKKKLNYAYYFTNIGLISFLTDVFFREEKAFLLLHTFIIATGILFFVSFLSEAYKKRVRKSLDVGIWHSLTAVLFLFLPVILGIIISIRFPGKELEMQIYLVYGISVFLGFITSLILGQTFKTLPFIIWLHNHRRFREKFKVRFPKDLYSENLAYVQYIIYLFSMPVLIFGIIISSAFFIRLGSALLFITAILYNVNVFKILFHSGKVNQT